MTTTETQAATLAERQIAGLRALANLIEANPEFAEDIDHTLKYGLLGMPQFTPGVDQRTRLAEWARAGKAHGAKITKDAIDSDFRLAVDFGAVQVRVLAERQEVCERVIVGTETVTETVPDPELLAKVPTVEVTKEREIVEWRCHPILSDATPVPQTEANAR